MAVQASLSGGYIDKTIDNPKNESCRATELRTIVVPLNPKG